MTKRKIIMILIAVLLLLIAFYVLLSPKKEKTMIEQTVPYSYSYWFTEPQIGDEPEETNNVIVFRHD